MESDTDLRASITEAFGENRSEVGALVIEGVDIVPVQMLRDAIADCMTAHRGMAAKPRIAIFGTLADGVASIQVEKGYFELGPIFDLDVLDWRTTYAGDTTIVANTLATAVDQSFWDMLAKENVVDADEASRLARLFTLRRDPAVEQAILRAYRALQFVRKRSTEVTSLQSLFYGWLLPYWRTRQITRDQVDAELDGGKVNGSEIDRRLQSLLADFAEEAPLQ